MESQLLSGTPKGWNPAMKNPWETPWRRMPHERIRPEEVGRPRLRMSNPIFAGYLEGITQALYDIYFLTVATVAPKLTLFSVQVGGQYNSGGVAAFNKTFDHTNLSQAGMLEAPNKHIIRAISVYAEGLQGNTNANNGMLAHPIDISNLLAVYLQLNINRKPYQDTVIGRLPAGGGLFISGTNATTLGAGQALQAAGNGWPVRDNTYSLAYGGIPLEQQQNFNAIIDPTQGNGGAFTSVTLAAVNGQFGAGISAWVFLDGTLFRAVQ